MGISATKFAAKYREAGWEVFPLLLGRKFPPPVGATGHSGEAVPEALFEMLVESLGGVCNLGLRTPDGVLGLDVDAYEGKEGAATLEALLEACGPLPDTWRSSARPDDLVSGIRFFRVPEGQLWETIAGPGIEVIQPSHRYAVVAPSEHPSGGFYEWTQPDGSRARGSAVPVVAELPMLPEAWVARLTRGAATGDEGVGDEMSKAEVKDWLQQRAGDLCVVMAQATARQVEMLGQQGAAHDALKTALVHVCKLAAEGHSGAWAAVNRIRGTFHAEVTGEHRPADTRRSLNEARSESVSMTKWAVRAAVKEVWADDCSCVSEGGDGSEPTMRASGQSQILVGSERTTLLQVRAALGAGSLQGFFRRGSELLWVPSMANGTWTPGDASVHLVNTKAKLQSLLLMHADCYGVSDKGEAFPTVVPKTWLDVALADVESLPAVREVDVVIHTPTLNTDGSLVQTPGFHDGLLYLPDGVFSGTLVADEPTRAEALKAARRVLWLISDFPFEDDNSQANYVALLLAPAVRRWLAKPSPLGVFSAPAAGSGKTHLAEALVLLYGGSLYPWPGKDELPKVITTALRSSGGVVVFDNAKSAIGGPELESLLTSNRHKARLFGKQVEVDLPNQKLWAVTSNNSTISEDVARRMLPVVLDAKMAKPHLRTGFKIKDWLGFVAEHREELLAALLTMARFAMSPEHGEPEVTRFDSFGRFAAFMQHLMKVCEIPGEVMSTAGAESITSESGEDVAEFLYALFAVMERGEFGVVGEPFLLRDLGRFMGRTTAGSSEEAQRLRAVLELYGTGRNGVFQPSTLGKWMAQWNKFVVDGMRMEKRMTRTHVIEWTLVVGK